MNKFKNDFRDEGLTTEARALVWLTLDEEFLLKRNLVDIDLLETIKDALEKQISRGTSGSGYVSDWSSKCHACSEEIINDTKYCTDCGQKLDWSGEGG